MKLTAIFLFRSKCLLGFLLAALFLLAPAADSLWGASENSDLRTRGKLAILGLRNAETIKSFHFPEDSYLVLIRPAGTQTPADTVPSLDTDQQSPAEAESDRYFVCLINHLSTGERLLLSDAADGRWDEIDFLDAVLIADGVSDRERAACREIYNRHLENLRREIGETDDDFEKVRHVYEYLHREILTGSYDLNLSSAAACLQTGIYNCVSATALFNALAWK